ncbi:MAG: universal stress protein [Nocardioidaceae bacterium]
MGAPRIVVGLDGSESAAAALRWAAGRAVNDGETLRVLHVYDAGSGLRLRSHAMRTASESHARARATAWVTEALGVGPQTARIALEVVEGNPNRVLAWLSRQADVLVLGAPRGTAVRRILGSSVARTCSFRASCPVVLVPGDRP